jgi:hypothetical protein
MSPRKQAHVRNLLGSVHDTRKRPTSAKTPGANTASTLEKLHKNLRKLQIRSHEIQTQRKKATPLVQARIIIGRSSRRKTPHLPQNYSFRNKSIANMEPNFTGALKRAFVKGWNRFTRRKGTTNKITSPATATQSTSPKTTK